MSKKKSGFPYEVHPTPAKGKDGKNIVYARPARALKMSIEGVDEYCSEHYSIPSGMIEHAFNTFIKGAGELMAMGYRIDTPIGSFVPRLALKREITDPDEVDDKDVELDGVDYKPGKKWNKAISKWLDNGFVRVENPNVQKQLDDKERLEAALRKSLQGGYTTVRLFALSAGLTNYTARKLLNDWTKGENPRLMKSSMGKLDIYIEI